MWKLLIADDEPKIRKGIRRIINWEQYGICDIVEVEDGEQALEIIQNNNINIMLLDINMPFLNGIQLLEKIQQIDSRISIIIISGYDEFSYAQKALKYNVLEYILKPVNKNELENVIRKALDKIEKDQKDKNYLEWANKQLDTNLEYFKNTIFSKWLSNKLSDKEMLEDLNFLGKRFDNNIGMILISTMNKNSESRYNKKWNDRLIEFAIENIVNEDFKDISNKIISIDDNDNIIIILEITDVSEWIAYKRELKKKINLYLKFDVILEQKNTDEGILSTKVIYNEILECIKNKKKYSKLVLHVINYLETNYYLSDININDIAKNLEVTPSYLSKLLKKETGLSFVEYLTDIRIKKSIILMMDTTIKIYDVAELVGYSNQHYFCRAFKKIKGISPTEYRRS